MRKDCQNSLIDGLFVAILIHVVGVHGAHGVVGPHLLRYDQIKCLIIAVLLSFNEVLLEGEVIE